MGMGRDKGLHTLTACALCLTAYPELLQQAHASETSVFMQALGLRSASCPAADAYLHYAVEKALNQKLQESTSAAVMRLIGSESCVGTLRKTKGYRKT